MTKVASYKSVAPGIRLNSRTKQYEALSTHYVGAFSGIKAAKDAREKFNRAVDKMFPPKRKAAKAEKKAKAKKPASAVGKNGNGNGKHEQKEAAAA